MVGGLEISITRRAGEGNDVADVGHAGDKEQETLEAQAEAGVGDRCRKRRVSRYPPHVLHRDVQLLDAGHQLVVTPPRGHCRR